MLINDTIQLDQNDIDYVGEHFRSEVFHTLDAIELEKDYTGPTAGSIAAEVEALIRERLAEMMAG